MKTKKLIFIFLSLFLYLGISFLSSASVFAQEVVRSITVVPPTIEKAVNPGDKTEGILKVINDTEVPITFIASVQDFIVEDTEGTPVMLPTNTLSNKYSAASWIGIQPSGFTIQPHQRQELNYFIQIPTDARPGGHYAAIVYTPQKTLAVQGTGTSVQTVIGSLFYISVAGQVNQQAVVSQFAANSFQEYGPVIVKTQIQNLGDIHIKPQGYISVQDMLGKTVYTIPLDTHNIFPEAKRNFQNTFGKHLMFGRYKAILHASYSNSNLPLSATFYIWVIPWKVILLILLIVAAGVLGVMYWMKRQRTMQMYVKTKTNQAQSQQNSPID